MVIAMTVVSTLIAGIFFLPRHLLPKTETPDKSETQPDGLEKED